MKKIVVFTFMLQMALFAQVSDREIANMFMLGFYGTKADSSSQVCKDLQRGLGGVILFSKRPDNRKLYKNFSTAQSLKSLNRELKDCNRRVLIAVDQEGGVVQRIKFRGSYPSAATIAKMGSQKAKEYYSAMAQELHSLGVNFNLAPVADLALNPKNRVIVGLGRSYGADWKKVVAYDKIFIDAMHSFRVATSLKHFPGHGSSLGDTHKGFVDVTNYWQPQELYPYYKLKNTTDTVMVAHVFNGKLDPKYPASLSWAVVTKKLRQEIGFRGVVISDDMQMGAIAKHYSLRDRVKLSINAGVDILLFANQLNKKSIVSLNTLINTVRSLLQSGAINEATIKAANARINRLKNKYK
jgi:beta-N-acetylhexosaminidase